MLGEEGGFFFFAEFAGGQVGEAGYCVGGEFVVDVALGVGLAGGGGLVVFGVRGGEEGGDGGCGAEFVEFG